MEKISNDINKLFQTLFIRSEKDNLHPFFNDMRQVNKNAGKHISHMKKYIKYTIPYDSKTIIP
jgi:hypothetical protein